MTQGEMFDGAGAVISSCERYRYRLYRSWGPGKRVGFVMLNPSTADETKNDPTIRRCIGFAQRWGYDGIEVVNLFAWRTTDPFGLDVQSCDIVGPHNDDAIKDAVLACDKIVCGWGNHGWRHKRNARVLELLRGLSCTPLAFGVTKGDQPRHPLYLSYGTELFRWDYRDRPGVPRVDPTRLR